MSVTCTKIHESRIAEKFKRVKIGPKNKVLKSICQSKKTVANCRRLRIVWLPIKENKIVLTRFSELVDCDPLPWTAVALAGNG